MKYLEIVKAKIHSLSTVAKIGIGILLIAILLGGIFLFNPKKKLIEYRNSERRTDIMNIMNAVYQYGADHGGVFPFELAETPASICLTGKVCQGIDLSEIAKQRNYQLSSVPKDPLEKDPNLSGYQISRLSNGRIKISAPLAENAVITLSK